MHGFKMTSAENVQQINDIQIMKDKILKIDTIFSLISEKQIKIATLETKFKKSLRENGKLLNKNDELVREIEKNQTTKEKMEDEYLGKILEERQKCDELENNIKKLKMSKNKHQINRKQLAKYKRIMEKKNKKYREATDNKYTRHIHNLRRTIKELRSRYKEQIVNKENIGVQTEVAIESGEVIECDIDQLINEMVSLPDLLKPFDTPDIDEQEPTKKMLSIQTQTIRSSVTRPVQTDPIVAIAKSCKETQTKSTHTLDIGIQCMLNIPLNDDGSNSTTCTSERQSMETQTDEPQRNIKQTQTDPMAVQAVSTQATTTPYEGKITLKRAVEVLKRSRATFSISNGMLIHYSKQPMSLSNESLIAKSVFRRLTKYVDQQYGNVRKARRRGFGNILNENKQLERSRNLMQMRFGFGLGSDTESSGYENHLVYKPKRDCSSVDSGMVSEFDLVVKGTDDDIDEEVDDVGHILEEVIDVPKMLSPLTIDDDIMDDNNESDHEHKRMKLDDTEVRVVIGGKEKEKNKRKAVSRMALLKRGIKKCNQVKLTQTSTANVHCNAVVEPAKKREAYKLPVVTSQKLQGLHENEKSKENNTDCDVICNLTNANAAGPKETETVQTENVKKSLGNNEEFQRIKRKVLERERRRRASETSSSTSDTSDKESTNEAKDKKLSLPLRPASEQKVIANDATMIQINNMKRTHDKVQQEECTNAKPKLHANDILSLLRNIEEHSYSCPLPPPPVPLPVTTNHTPLEKTDILELTVEVESPQSPELESPLSPDMKSPVVLESEPMEIPLTPQVPATETAEVPKPPAIITRMVTRRLSNAQKLNNQLSPAKTTKEKLTEPLPQRDSSSVEMETRKSLFKKPEVSKSPNTFNPLKSHKIPLDVDAVSDDDLNVGDGDHSDANDSDESVQSQCVSKSLVKGPTYKEAKVIFDHLVRFQGHPKIYKDDVEVLQRMSSVALVNFVIQYLKSDFSEVEETKNYMEPLLTMKQKVLIGIMLRFERESHQELISLLIKCVENYLLYNVQRTVEALEHMSRFYTALCRMRRLKHRVRVFIADLLYIAPRNKFVIIYKIVTSWFNVLIPYTESNNGVGIDRVLSYIALTRDNAEDESVGVLKNLLITYYKFPKDPPSADDLMMSLLESYMCGSHVQFEVAILILCMYSTPEWIYEKAQLIGELCNVSKDEEIIRSFVQLIGKMKKKLPHDHQLKLQQFGCELITRLEKVNDMKDIKELHFKER